ncbi:type III secretion system (T3SS) SseB-like protein [Motilibacter peucedani]|uniref:Type III secretion system (T3SS) SseB-like protein n=1 Tax=Motilibacter peucedani TaxID=598650 RepID=A0A420XSL7_9ACTN|nr:SseB family protein [Motilibacter peucedani]RKS77811.1 type III secretion system (T3SS) SseB-like protein [Motilibacter peucedani]
MSDAPRTIPDTGFAGDTGEGDPALVAALERYAVEPGRAPEVLSALAGARVLVAVVAVLTAEDEPVDGLRREKSTDMALVTVQRPDGARAVPAFTSLASLAAWRDDARPVPVEASRAALSAAAEGAVALLLDPAGPVPCVVSGPALRAVAEGTVPQPMYADAGLGAHVRALASAAPGVAGARLEPAPGVDARLVLTLAPGADVQAALAVLGPVLQADETLRVRTLAGLDVAVEG